MCRGGSVSAPFSRPTASSTECSASMSIGCRTTDSGGETSSVQGLSSNTIRLRSPGTSIADCLMRRRALRTWAVLPTMMPVGGAGSASSALTASPPESPRNGMAWMSRSSTSVPAAAIALRKPATRSRPVEVDSGPEMNAIRSWPRPSMCWVAVSAESSLLIATTSTPGSSSISRSTNTMLTPRLMSRRHLSTLPPVGVAMTEPTDRPRSVSRDSPSRCGSSWFVRSTAWIPRARASQTTRSASRAKNGLARSANTSPIVVVDCC